MGDSSSSTPQQIVTTQNKDPWTGAQPYLSNALGWAQSFFNSSTGYQPYSGQTLADLHPWLQEGQNAEKVLSTGNQFGSPGVNAGLDLATNMIQNQGLTPDIRNAFVGLDNASGLWGNILGQNMGNTNPYLQQVINAQMDQVNSAMSGAGRYGSGAHQAAIAKAIAPTLAQDYLQRQQLQMQALQGQQGAYQQKMDAIGQGLNRAGQYSQLAPQLDEAQYSPSQHMQQLGNFYSNRNQQALANSINLYNAQQAWPWEQLARFNAIATGAGGLGGSQVTTQPNLNAPAGGLTGALGGALSGGATGYSIFGPIGGALGAIGGGLYGGLR